MFRCVRGGSFQLEPYFPSWSKEFNISASSWSNYERAQNYNTDTEWILMLRGQNANARVVGYVCYSPSDNAIYRVEVHKFHRRQKIGTALLRSVPKGYLIVPEENIEARLFLNRIGAKYESDEGNFCRYLWRS